MSVFFFLQFCLINLSLHSCVKHCAKQFTFIILLDYSNFIMFSLSRLILTPIYVAFSNVVCVCVWLFFPATLTGFLPKKKKKKENLQFGQLNTLFGILIRIIPHSHINLGRVDFLVRLSYLSQKWQISFNVWILSIS